MSNPIGRRWADLTDTERAALPIGTVIAFPGGERPKRKTAPGEWTDDDGDTFCEEPWSLDVGNVVVSVPGFALREAPPTRPLVIPHAEIVTDPDHALAQLSTLLNVPESEVVDAVQTLLLTVATEQGKGEPRAGWVFYDDPNDPYAHYVPNATGRRWASARASAWQTPTGWVWLSESANSGGDAPTALAAIDAAELALTGIRVPTPEPE